MLTDVLLPESSCFFLEQLSVDPATVTLTLAATPPEALCSRCRHPSSRIHCWYHRSVADLPWARIPVRLQLHVRKFVCRNPDCPQTIFAERFPAIVAPCARRTLRLADDQRHLALDHGGEAGARTATRLGMPTSPDTLLRLTHQTPAAEPETPRVLGVDDWAWRKGRTYGTILVDLEQHQPIDLLPDRTAETLRQWLAEHPGVEIISRDRAGAYADGATQGAPDAIQVADRFHLLQNVREALQRMLDRNQEGRRAAVEPPAEPAGADPDPVPTSLGTTLDPPTPYAPVLQPSVTDTDCPVRAQEAGSESAVMPVPAPVGGGNDLPAVPLGSQAERQRQERRARRYARYTEVRALHAQGLSIREIADQLHLSRQTVRRFIAADAFPERGRPRKRGVCWTRMSRTFESS